MQKAKKNKRLFLILSASLLGAALLLTLGVILFFVYALYVPAIIFAALSGGGYYAALFLFFEFWDAATAIEIIPILQKHAEGSLKEICAELSYKERTAERLIKKFRKRGYIL